MDVFGTQCIMHYVMKAYGLTADSCNMLLVMSTDNEQSPFTLAEWHQLVKDKISV